MIFHLRFFKQKFVISSSDLERLSKISQSDSNSTTALIRDYALQINLIDKSTGIAVAQSDIIPFRISSQRIIAQNYTFNLQNVKSWSMDNPNLYEISANILQMAICLIIIQLRVHSGLLVSKIMEIYQSSY